MELSRNFYSTDEIRKCEVQFFVRSFKLDQWYAINTLTFEFGQLFISAAVKTLQNTAKEK